MENGYAWASRFKDFEWKVKPSLPTKFYPTDTLAHTLTLIEKHGRFDPTNQVYSARLNQELNLLHNNGIIDLLPYFFIDEDVTSVYRDAGLLVGPGRGSAAGLYLSYLLGITHVDPLKYNLSVDRFLTMDRIKSGKMPDIDQDLPSRDLLIDPETGWLKKRFGDHYAQLSTDTTLKCRSAVKDVARALLGHVPPEIEALTRDFLQPPQGLSDSKFVFGYEDAGSWVPGVIDPCLPEEKQDKALIAYIKAYPGQWEIVKKCLGLVRGKSRHACLPAGERIFTFDETNPKVEIEQCHNRMVKTGKGMKAKATLLYQGSREVMEYVLENGQKLRATPDHLVLTKMGWMEIQRAMDLGIDLEIKDIGK